MNIHKLEGLLHLPESEELEYKQSLDVSSQEGKAILLKTILSLANSSRGDAFLVIGVQDKTRKIVGAKEIPEERVQDILAEWVVPSLRVEVYNFRVRRKIVPLIRVMPAKPPYSLKKRFGYQVNSARDKKHKKQAELKPSQVFVRRGSTIHEAEVADLLEIINRDQSNLESHLSRIAAGLEDLGYEIRDNYLRGFPAETNRYVETVSVSIVAGVAISWLLARGHLEVPLTTMLLVFSIMVIGSAAGKLHFGVWRAILTSTFVSVVFSFWFNSNLGLSLTEKIFLPLANPATTVFVGITIGAAGGIISQGLTNFVVSRIS